ncbi:hypothetical protein C3766_03900 [Heyndrickxia coagulans]|nr:hypothetical protein C3766_03900 [Heyndrickxia coagulans]
MGLPLFGKNGVAAIGIGGETGWAAGFKRNKSEFDNAGISFFSLLHAGQPIGQNERRSGSFCLIGPSN